MRAELTRRIGAPLRTAIVRRRAAHVGGGYFMFGAGVLAPGGLSGAGGGVPVPAGTEPSAGVAPLSVVVLPVVEAPEGSIGGGALEPPQATTDKQLTNKNAKVEVRVIP